MGVVNGSRVLIRRTQRWSNLSEMSVTFEKKGLVLFLIFFVDTSVLKRERNKPHRALKVAGLCLLIVEKG